MRLVTVRTDDGTRAGRISGGDIGLLDHADVGEALRSGVDLAAATTVGSVAVEGADLAPVVTNPSKVFCLGLNYRPHIEEMGHDMPEYPTLFPKFAASLCGPFDPIPLPAESDQVDSEAELVLVIGKSVRRADESEAAAAIAGFTVGNDMSMRDWQSHTSQFTAGKGWEGSSPIGPALVTPDEVGGARPSLPIHSQIDGVTFQSADTGELVIDPVDSVRYISTFVTLEPGDVIFTGTPGGVGAARTPPVFLEPGQTILTTIEGVGQLRNECVAET